MVIKMIDKIVGVSEQFWEFVKAIPRGINK